MQKANEPSIAMEIELPHSQRKAVNTAVASATGSQLQQQKCCLGRMNDSRGCKRNEQGALTNAQTGRMSKTSTGARIDACTLLSDTDAIAS